MKRFDGFHSFRDAVAHAAEGGQALHTFQWVETSRAPGCFNRDIRAGKQIAHLIDHDLERLKKTARRLGVRVIAVDMDRRHRGEAQHIDLCGKPLEKAIAMCEKEKVAVDA